MEWWQPHMVTLVGLVGLGLWLATGALLLPLYGRRLRTVATTEGHPAHGHRRVPHA